MVWAEKEENRKGNAAPNLPRIIIPQPPHHVRQDRRAVPGVVRPLAEDELVVVALLLEHGGERLVRLGPRAGLVEEVVRAILLEDPNRLLLRLAHEIGI